MASPNKNGKVPVTFRLTEELDRKIKAESQRLGISKNAYVQMILVQMLDKMVG